MSTHSTEHAVVVAREVLIVAVHADALLCRILVAHLQDPAYLKPICAHLRGKVQDFYVLAVD